MVVTLHGNLFENKYYMGGFKVLESYNISVWDLYFTIFALPIMFYIAAYIHYSCMSQILSGWGPIKRPTRAHLRQ